MQMLVQSCMRANTEKTLEQSCLSVAPLPAVQSLIHALFQRCQILLCKT